MLQDIEQVRAYIEHQTHWGQRPHSAVYARLETLRYIAKWQQYKPVALSVMQHRTVIRALRGKD